MQYFRKRKKTRQMIIITHNPNLVVNTDSEQVIAADYDGGRMPRIVYTSGSLENTSRDASNPGIREKVCSILEGGSEAFRRENRNTLFRLLPCKTNWTFPEVPISALSPSPATFPQPSTAPIIP